jgi:molybdenum cofactor biosynthesis enzyme MoaA
MKIQTMSIVCGTRACNAHCPFCVSKTTPEADLSTEVNWRNFEIACRLAEKSGATTCLITGKGEPTLYPDLIASYVHRATQTFPIIELQTNAIRIGDGSLGSSLRDWHYMGLTTICISAVHYEQERNQEIYSEDYPDLTKVVEGLKDIGYSVRLSTMMLRGYIDSWSKVGCLADFCADVGIDQLTIRPIAAPENNVNDTTQWIMDHTLNDYAVESIKMNLAVNASPVLHLAHGATVYDWNGQNICLTDCLTTNKTDDNMRQIIFFPDGHIGYDWKYKGAILI